MPDWIPKLNDRVTLLFMLGDGSYRTHGVVRSVDSDKVFIEETEYSHFDYDRKTKTGSFRKVPFDLKKSYQSSATRWFTCLHDNHPTYNLFSCDLCGDVDIEMESVYDEKVKT